MMEMIPVAGLKDRRLSRSLRRTDSSLSDPLLPHDDVYRRSRPRRPLLDAGTDLTTTMYSSYQPPRPLGLETDTEQEFEIDKHLFFDFPSKPQRHPAEFHNDNPAKDMGGFFSHGCCCVQCVRTQEIGITENFGRFQEIVAPGFYCMVWPMASIAGRLSLRIQQLDVVCETKTKDDGSYSHTIHLSSTPLTKTVTYSCLCIHTSK